MRALTVRQPFATALVRGMKPVENRTWDFPRWGASDRYGVAGAVGPHAPGREVEPTWIAVHAGQVERALDAPQHVVVALQEEVRGAVLGAVLIDWTGPRIEYGLRYGSLSWATGPRCWHVARAVELHEPIAVPRGSLGLWRLPDEVAAQLHSIGARPTTRQEPLE